MDLIGMIKADEETFEIVFPLFLGSRFAQRGHSQGKAFWRPQDLQVIT